MMDACKLPTMPAEPLALTGDTTLDTDAGTFSGNAPVATSYAVVMMPQRGGGPDAFVLYTSAFEQTAGTLLVTGSHPLVIASESTIDVMAAMDASSRGGASPNVGPGAKTAMGCMPPMRNGANGGDGGGGGGGALGANSGAGGAGGAAGGPAGMGLPVPMFVRAGCAGGNGGKAATSTGGYGGGGIALVARGIITVNGTISAGGMGGAGSVPKSGGGGGGSGGMIVLSGASVVIGATAIVAANGGGGGGGSNGEDGGGQGGDGSASATPAPGGTSDASHPGGDGGAAAIPAMVGGSGGGGGGGGGGGSVGYVLVHAHGFAPAGLISPAATVMP